MRGVRGSLHPRTHEALVDARKSIVLLNRRGWSNFLSCQTCGHAWECPQCDVTLVLHRASATLACHHCGHRERVPSRCAECGSVSIGAARHRDRAPRDRAARARCSASTATPARAAAVLAAFERADRGILLGTQMVAKGHDFPDVELGVVVDADQTLRFPDFRAEERTFALVAQLAGRAGRGPRGGRVLVQTLAPDAPSILLAGRHDAATFLAGELERRRALRYPPFSTLIRVVCSSERPGAAQAAARRAARAPAGRARPGAALPPARQGARAGRRQGRGSCRGGRRRRRGRRRDRRRSRQPQGEPQRGRRPAVAGRLAAAARGREDAQPMTFESTATRSAPAAAPALGAATLCEAFQITAGAHPDAVAHRSLDGSVELTWEQYAARVRSIAGGLHALGVRRGDCVALLLANRPEFNLVDTAAMHLGAAPFSLYNTLSAEQVAYQLRQLSGARGRHRAASTSTTALAAPGPDVRSMSCCVDGSARRRDRARTTSRRALPTASTSRPPWRAVRPDDVLTVIYTSGTTGPPKGAQLTHAGHDLAELPRGPSVLPITPRRPPACPTCRRRTSPTASSRTTTRRCCSAPRSRPSPIARQIGRRAAARSGRRPGAPCRASGRSSRPRSRPRGSPTRQRSPRSQAGGPGAPRPRRRRAGSVSGAAPIPARGAAVLHSTSACRSARSGGCPSSPASRRSSRPTTSASARSARRSPASSCASPTTASCSCAPRWSCAATAIDPETADAIDADGWLHTGDVADDRRRRLRHDRRPQEGAHHQRGRQEHVAREHRAAAEGLEPADRPGRLRSATGAPTTSRCSCSIPTPGPPRGPAAHGPTRRPPRSRGTPELRAADRGGRSRPPTRGSRASSRSSGSRSSPSTGSRAATS